MSERTESFRGKRVSRRTTFEVSAPPAVVFPLLCPVREREWLDGWTSEIIYSESGLAEDDCVFTSSTKLLGEAVYAVSRHEKERGIIEFVVFYPGKCVQKIEVALSPAPGGGTRVAWSRTYTGLSAEGNVALEAMTEESFQEQFAALAQGLERGGRE